MSTAKTIAVSRTNSNNSTGNNSTMVSPLASLMNSVIIDDWDWKKWYVEPYPYRRINDNQPFTTSTTAWLTQTIGYTTSGSHEYDLPGIDIEDISVELNEQTRTLKVFGKTKPEAKRQRTYTYTIHLDQTVDQENIKLELSNGVLTVTLVELVKKKQLKIEPKVLPVTEVVEKK